MAKRFFGFGFGPIQTGLFLHEAAQSGRFEDFAISEVDRYLVDAVKAHGGTIRINIAGTDGIRTKVLSGIRIFDPSTDGAEIGRAIRDADELSTAVPSVELYGSGGETSIASLLAANIRPDKPRILYAAENHNFAAELLWKQIAKRAPESRLSRFRILNTVIGKMSGTVSSTAEMRSLNLQPLVPGFDRCVLVEEFSRILISRVTLPGFRRGIAVFEEKDDLLPFEEAKLHGHNAVHALLGYLAWMKGFMEMSEVREDSALMSLGREAFVNESGTALIRKHGGTGDPLFTQAGYVAYAEDLLSRMTNPHLHDRIERIVRDPRRKLGYGDRLIGTMREAMKQGVEPKVMALGAAAALVYAMEREAGRGGMPRTAPSIPWDDQGWLKRGHEMDSEAAQRFLLALWENETPDEYRDACVSMVQDALARLEELIS